MLFDVRVTAFDPQAAVDPVEALMRLFKIDRAFAREVVHRLPRVIKRGVPLETARRLSQVLEESLELCGAATILTGVALQERRLRACANRGSER